MDYVLNVYKNEEFLFAIGGKHMYYDNVIWWQLEKLINLVDRKEMSREQLINEIEKNTEYFEYIECDENEYKDEPKIDLVKRIIDKPYVPIFDTFEDVYEDTPINKIIEKDNVYYAEYDEGDQYKMENVEFDEELLRKTNVSFDEFLKISNFINSIQELDNDTDFILNNSLVLRLNNI